MTAKNLHQSLRIYPIKSVAAAFFTIRRDIASIIERDPAARNVLEALLCYPGLHAVWGYRVANWFWIHNLKLLGRWISQVVRSLTGIEIHPGAILGPGLFIDHGMGVVIGETVEIGEGVTLYHGVTLGGTNNVKKKRHPTVGDRVVIGAGAKVLGAIAIGDDSRIGVNSVVVKSVPANSVVVGVPGQNVARAKSPRLRSVPDLNHTKLPDVIGITLKQLVERVDSLENQISGNETIKPATLISKNGTWQVEDFSI